MDCDVIGSARVLVTLDTEMRIWRLEWVTRSPSRRVRGWTGKEPRKLCVTPILWVLGCDLGCPPGLEGRERGQRMVTGDANDGGPKVDPGWPWTESRGGVWVRAALRYVSQDRVPGSAVMGGETRSPEKYYGLHWEIGEGRRRGWGGGAVWATPGGRHR